MTKRRDAFRQHLHRIVQEWARARKWEPRRWLAPEVIQSSAMDCGPAALKALLSWFGVTVSYDRLRELCQTDVDGTSVDVLEMLAVRLGVDVTQQMLPRDATLEMLGEVAPCLLVTKLPVGMLHFQVVWSKIAGWLQVMNPASGRVWMRNPQLSEKLYIHKHEVPGEAWMQLIHSGPFLPWLGRRLRGLGLGDRGPELLAEWQRQGSWREIAAADAAARMAHWLVTAGHIPVGVGSARLFEHCLNLARHEIRTGQPSLPPSHWFARVSQRSPDQVTLQGSVLLVPSEAARRGQHQPSSRLHSALARLQQPASTFVGELRKLVRAQDKIHIGMLLGAVGLSACGALAELMIFRASSSLVQRLGVTHQRLAAVALFAVFLGALLVLDLLIVSTSQLLGRQLEGRLRLSLLYKIPRLPDSYFRSRLLSDMAQRAHMLYQLRGVPMTLQGLVRSSLDLLVTVAAICLLQPSLATITLLGAIAAVVLPMAASRWVFELEDRVQHQQGSLSAIYLDALAGLTPLRTHGAEPSLVGEHQNLLVDWYRSASERQRALVLSTMLQLLTSALLAIALVVSHVRQGLTSQSLLLLLFWAQRIPQLGQSIAQATNELAPIRSSLLRITEPLRQEADENPGEASPPLEGLPVGVKLEFRGVRVVAGGQEILRNLNLQIDSGEHIAIVGRSGAGKSSLLGVLLGVQQTSGGKVLVDGEVVAGPKLFGHLQPHLSWVDPSVQLWNETLLSNIQFGSQGQPQHPIAQVVSQAELLEVLDRLPEGFQTLLGDSGSLVSGGEGQRVRLARAMLRRGSRLVLLDEPFRGLDRSKRRLLLERARTLWSTATILCVTHDVSETEAFDRVLVVHEGEVAEDDTPARLLSISSQYRQLHEADRRASSVVWAAEHWRRIRVEGGQITDLGPNTT